MSARAAFLFLLGLVDLYAATSPGRSVAQEAPPPASRATVASPVASPFARTHRNVSTKSDRASAAFDDGLTLLYAFNPEEARVAFHRALDADPNLAIAWWGVAMSYWPNINTSFDGASQRNGRDAIRRAVALSGGASPVERALINAAVARFSFDRDADADRSARAYRDAMYVVASDYASDDDVQTLAAEAEMDVHPWSYFDADGTPTAGTPGIVSRLQTVLARDPDHIGAEHFLIHALEESPHPEGALDAAQRLAADSFEPAAEHLIHMPAHTFMRAGLYHEAGIANARAVAAYRTYLAGSPAGHRDYLGHDCSFGVDAFGMSGEYARARQLAVACERTGLMAIADLRFGRYDVLASDTTPNALVTGMLAAHDGRDAEANAQLAILRKDRDDVGRISAALLAARIAARRGDRAAEIAALTDATGIQRREGYSEPPQFWMPAGEALGAAEYRAGRFADAEATFRATLARDRDDPRALFGLARTLEREGRDDDARATDARFETAWRQADVRLDMNDL